DIASSMPAEKQLAIDNGRDTVANCGRERSATSSLPRCRHQKGAHRPSALAAVRAVAARNFRNSRLSIAGSYRPHTPRSSMPRQTIFLCVRVCVRERGERGDILCARTNAKGELRPNRGPSERDLILRCRFLDPSSGRKRAQGRYAHRRIAGEQQQQQQKKNTRWCGRARKEMRVKPMSGKGGRTEGKKRHTCGTHAHTHS
ncbi:hypothetical protein DQ04_15601000, partial [Trypanosoma grayi]|uniref:hypothetical protein n=1 Tax=Trypanosoma grayi TaxID=71804 RepID=UPI0004F41AB6